MIPKRRSKNFLLRLVGSPLLRDTSRLTTSQRGFRREVDVLVRVQADEERRNIHELVLDANVAVPDEDAGVVDRARKSHLVHAGLQPALEEHLRRELEDEVELELIVTEETEALDLAEERVALEDPLRVLLRERQEHTRGLAELCGVVR